MKAKTANKRKNAIESNSTSIKLVNSIMQGDNVNAYKLLEKRLREKVAEKIDNALKDE